MPTRSGRAIASFAARAAALAALLAAPLAAQREPKPEKVDAFADPYTEGDPARLQALGYAALGRFLWLGDVPTTQVQQILGDDVAIFIETAHFKLASTLRSFPWPRDKEWRAALRAELDALAEACPSFRIKPRSLDPWLRAHLYARRLEALYTDFCTRFAIDQKAFPKERGSARTADYLGEGPYLGQPEKYLVVLTHKALSAGTYTRAFHGVAASDSTRHNHVDQGALAVVVADEFAEKTLRDDRNLHSHVVYLVCHNLVDGYKFYWQTIPAWLSEGIPLWFGRQVHPKFLNFAGTDTTGSTVLEAHEWERRVRLRVEHDVWPEAGALCKVMAASELDFVEHMMVWSRVDHLLQNEPAKFAAFLARMKAPMTDEARLPTTAEVLQRQEQALREELGLDYAGFDEAWAQYVRAKYPKK
jgi:hypothetical protein